MQQYKPTGLQILPRHNVHEYQPTYAKTQVVLHVHLLTANANAHNYKDRMSFGSQFWRVRLWTRRMLLNQVFGDSSGQQHIFLLTRDRITTGRGPCICRKLTGPLGACKSFLVGKLYLQSFPLCDLRSPLFPSVILSTKLGPLRTLTVQAVAVQ